ncbi:MAG: phosphoglycolate phosphatase [Cellvibrionaceae bacterium]
MSFPQLVIFDLDGTLIDSVPDLALAIDRTLSELGLPTAGESLVREWVGNGAAKLVERALRFAMPLETMSLEASSSEASELNVEAMHAKALGIFFEQYHDCNAQRTVLYPGTLDALLELKTRNITMAIVTNKPKEFVPPILSALNIAHYFDFVLGGDELDNKKPHPQPLLYCMSELGFEASQTLMVGDSRNDIESARAADVLVAAVNYGYNHGRPIEDENPDYVLSDLRELTALKNN